MWARRLHGQREAPRSRSRSGFSGNDSDLNQTGKEASAGDLFPAPRRLFKRQGEVWHAYSGISPTPSGDSDDDNGSFEGNRFAFKASGGGKKVVPAPSLSEDVDETSEEVPSRLAVLGGCIRRSPSDDDRTQSAWMREAARRRLARIMPAKNQKEAPDFDACWAAPRK